MNRYVYILIWIERDILTEERKFKVNTSNNVLYSKDLVYNINCIDLDCIKTTNPFLWKYFLSFFLNAWRPFSLYDRNLFNSLDSNYKTLLTCWGNSPDIWLQYWDYKRPGLASYLCINLSYNYKLMMN